ncbi:MAG: virginiamycin B lyase family protein, partial [Vulcanimicrobiaceae bacterium]
PNGSLWFTEYDPARVGRIDAHGRIAESPLANPGSGPTGIASGRDGRVWFTEYTGGAIGRINASGN